ncbi:hypothetical protein Zmor_024928 [Zophobas morio]|uniref:Uncharacterized protein n=1 Tax=Zophobas morio TaxID=2755281 RepID=A0AA38M416_9CUCU|nr:hypothetical protein Zmor_024928 [Zophobas morio]
MKSKRRSILDKLIIIIGMGFFAAVGRKKKVWLMVDGRAPSSERRRVHPLQTNVLKSTNHCHLILTAWISWAEEGTAAGRRPGPPSIVTSAPCLVLCDVCCKLVNCTAKSVDGRAGGGSGAAGSLTPAEGRTGDGTLPYFRAEGRTYSFGLRYYYAIRDNFHHYNFHHDEPPVIVVSSELFINAAAGFNTFTRHILRCFCV